MTKTISPSEVFTLSMEKGYFAKLQVQHSLWLFTVGTTRGKNPSLILAEPLSSDYIPLN